MYRISILDRAAAATPTARVEFTEKCEVLVGSRPRKFARHERADFPETVAENLIAGGLARAVSTLNLHPTPTLPRV